MTPQQQRVIDELTELEIKLTALTELLVDAPRVKRLGIDGAELARLRRQHTYMRLYIDVLRERIEVFVEID